MVDVGLVEQLGSEAYIHFEKHLPPVITPDIQDLAGRPGAGTGNAWVIPPSSPPGSTPISHRSWATRSSW